jgi:hypothetical protein
VDAGALEALEEEVVLEPRPWRRWRVAAFVAVAAVCVSCVAGFTARAARQVQTASRRSSARLAETGGRTSTGGDRGPSRPSVALTASLPDLLARPHLLVRDSTEGADFDRVEVADLADLSGPRAVTPLGCARMDQVGSRGLCLVARPTSNSRVLVFDAGFRILATLQAYGTPSRTRVAPNGAVGAETTFVNGDSYNVDNFSTRTEFVDLVRGTFVADLESFQVTLDGRPIHPVDENFWGVTFAADSDTFYATMRTGSHFSLIRGRLGTRQAEVLRDGVECPAISPDGTRLVYKSRIEHGFDPATWRLHVLDLATLTDHPLAETRSVDDQAAWLDDAHVVYGVPELKPNSSVVDTWSVPADGSGQPVLAVPAGDSPVVLRAPAPPAG